MAAQSAVNPWCELPLGHKPCHSECLGTSTDGERGVLDRQALSSPPLRDAREDERPPSRRARAAAETSERKPMWPRAGRGSRSGAVHSGGRCAGGGLRRGLARRCSSSSSRLSMVRRLPAIIGVRRPPPPHCHQIFAFGLE